MSFFWKFFIVMMYLNAITLTGHVGAIEIVKVPAKKGFKAQVITPQQAEKLDLQSKDFSLKVTLSVALNESWTNGSNEIVEETHWFTVESWGRSALNIAKYVSVGRFVSIQGKLSTKVLEEQGWDSEKGESCVLKRKVTFIKAAQNGVILLDKKPEPEPQSTQSAPRPMRLVR